MLKYNVLIIGNGQLGSRHLQGLAKSKLELNLFLVEPNPQNLHVALQRFEEAEPSGTVQIVQTVSSVEELKENLFQLVIIATNADKRAEMTKRLLNKHAVENMIFEKVAFQSESQFEDIIALLKHKKVKSWVNCTRRYFPFYQSLREKLYKNHPLSIELTGVEWGLACNAVHHIDLLSFLSGEITFQPGESLLDNQIYESKRKCFKEFYGSISGLSKSGNHFNLVCDKAKKQDEKPWMKIRIGFEAKHILIDEIAGKADFFNGTELLPYRTEEINLIYQSALTNLQAYDILIHGTSLLPSIEESYESHKPLFKILREHFFKVTGKKPDIIPIT